jgi:hypothetical protein
VDRGTVDAIALMVGEQELQRGLAWVAKNGFQKMEKSE